MLITVFSNSVPDSPLYLLLTAACYSLSSLRNADELKIQLQEKITENHVCTCGHVTPTLSTPQRDDKKPH